MEQQSDTFLAESRGPQTLAIAIVFPILAAVTVVLRFYTRLLIIRNAALEDFSMGLAMLLSIAVTVCTCYEVHYGLGRHIRALKPPQLVGDMKSLYASIIIYNFGLLFTKLSIMLQYLRICVPRSIRRAVYGVMFFVIAYGIETFFTGVLTCTPVRYFWDTTIPDGKCVDKWALYFANAGINIVTDFAILVLPVFILKDLLMPTRQKVALMVILALGGAACIASIFRLHSLYILSKSQDPTWDSPGTAIWSCIELNIGIFCASISTLRPFFSRFLPGIFGTTHNSKGPRRTPYVFSRTRTRQLPGDGRFDPMGDEGALRRDSEPDRIGEAEMGMRSDEIQGGDEDNGDTMRAVYVRAQRSFYTAGSTSESLESGQVC